MPRYLAEYYFEHTESSLRPKDQMYGKAKMEVDLSKDIESREESDEVAKFLFNNTPDCAKIVVTRLDKIIEDGQIVEGEIVE